MVAQVASDFGAINGLVNNAGILRDGLTIKVKDGQLSKMSLAQWQSVIDVNLTGVFLCTREVAAKMIELKNEGAIVNISSISRAGNMGQANYSAAKAGVAADTVVWAKELARYGIRVAGVAPGFIETEMTAGMKPEALEKMTAGIPSSVWASRWRSPTRWPTSSRTTTTPAAFSNWTAACACRPRRRPAIAGFSQAGLPADPEAEGIAALVDVAVVAAELVPFRLHAQRSPAGQLVADPRLGLRS